MSQHCDSFKIGLEDEEPNNEKEIVSDEESHKDTSRKRLQELVEEAKYVTDKVKEAKTLQKDYENCISTRGIESLTK